MKLHMSTCPMCIGCAMSSLVQPGAHTFIHMLVHMSVHMFVQMTVHMSAHVSTHMFVHMSTHMSAHMSVHMSVRMSVHMTARHAHQHGRCLDLTVTLTWPTAHGLWPVAYRYVRMTIWPITCDNTYGPWVQAHCLYNTCATHGLWHLACMQSPYHQSLSLLCRN